MVELKEGSLHKAISETLRDRYRKYKSEKNIDFLIKRSITLLSQAFKKTKDNNKANQIRYILADLRQLQY